MKCVIPPFSNACKDMKNLKDAESPRCSGVFNSDIFASALLPVIYLFKKTKPRMRRLEQFYVDNSFPDLPSDGTVICDKQTLQLVVSKFLWEDTHFSNKKFQQMQFLQALPSPVALFFLFLHSPFTNSSRFVHFRLVDFYLILSAYTRIQSGNWLGPLVID